MPRIKTWKSRGYYPLFLTMYIFSNFIKKKRPLHIIVSGPDDGSAELLVRRLSEQLGEHTAQIFEGPALDAEKLNHPLIISIEPDDFLRTRQINRVLGRTRRLAHIGVVANPADLLCERSKVLPHHFRQSADYRLIVGPGATRSYSGPGLIARFNALEETRALYPRSTLVVTREELTRDIEATLDRSLQFIDSLRRKSGRSTDGGDSPTQTGSAPNETRSESCLSRCAHEMDRCPELAKLFPDFGYSLPPRPKQTKKPTVRGTIVAFHTADALYTAEANRLKGSLDALGLQYEIRTIEKGEDWARTNLRKPSWIQSVREEITGPLLYVDVDSYFRADPWPHLQDIEGDMAAFIHPGGPLAGAVVWVDDTDSGRALLETWRERCEERITWENPGTPWGNDQGVLKILVEEIESQSKPEFAFARLIPNLAQVFDRDYGFIFGPPIIELLQASREHRGNAGSVSTRQQRIGELETSARPSKA